MSEGHFTTGGHFIVLSGVTSEGHIDMNHCDLHEVLQPVYQPDFMNSELARVNYKKMIERYIVVE